MEGNKAIPNKKMNWRYVLLTHGAGKIDYWICASFFFSFSFYTSLVISVWKWLFCFFHKCEWAPRIMSPWCFIKAFRYYQCNSIYSSTDSVSLKSSVKEVTGRPEASQPCNFPTACGTKFCYFQTPGVPVHKIRLLKLHAGRDGREKCLWLSVQQEYFFPTLKYCSAFLRYHNSLWVSTSERAHLCQWDLVP